MILGKKVILTFILLFFLSLNLKASKWTDWKDTNFVPIKFNDIQQLIGNGSFINSYSEGKMDAGKKATQYWIENYSSEGYLILNYLKMPQGWIITDSGNDKKYIISEAQYLLNVDRKDNPIRKIKKRDIERYRDVHNNVVPYVFFDYENSSCIIFKKGFFKRDSGFVVSANDDETLSGVFCKNQDTIDQNFAHQLINSIQVKQ